MFIQKNINKTKKVHISTFVFCYNYASEEQMENYQNILYKKRAIESLAIIISQTEAKKILFLASKTAYQSFGTLVTNQLALADCEFVLKLLPSQCTKQNVQDAILGARGCTLAIALGGASICDITKIVATTLDMPFVLIPSMPSNFGYFTLDAYLQQENVYKKMCTNQAYKILVDENIVTKADRKQVVNGQKLVLSLYEVLFSCQFDNLFYNDKKDLTNLKLQLSKFKDNYEYLQSDTDDSKLVLMDILIELAKATEDMDSINVFDIAFCLKTKSNLPFGTLCLLASKILANLYKQTFEIKNIYKLSLPNFDVIDQNLSSLNINKKDVNFTPLKSMFDNSIYKKINAIKNQCLALCENLESQLSNFCLPKDKSELHLDDVCKVMNIVPLIYNCSSLVNMIYGMGLLNIC